MEKSLTPEESLQIIQKSISNSRKNLREGSFYYLLWGIFVTGAIVFLAAAVVTIYVEGTAQLLVLAGALVLGYLVPGYLLRKIKNGDNV